VVLLGDRKTASQKNSEVVAWVESRYVRDFGWDLGKVGEGKAGEEGGMTAHLTAMVDQFDFLRDLIREKLERE
jgi:hypothetical protein